MPRTQILARTFRIFVLAISMVNSASLAHGSHANNGEPVKKTFLVQTIIPSLTRSLLPLPFDTVIIAKQLSGDSYIKIIGNKVLRKRMLPIMLPQIAQSSIQTWYTYTIAAGLKQCFRNEAPEFDAKYPFISKLTIASAIVAVDGVLLTPLERFKVCIIEKLPLRIYDKGGINIKWLYRGNKLTLYTRFIHINLFLFLNDFFSNLFYPNHKGPYTIGESALIGTALAGIQSTITYPLMTLRTKLQAERLKDNGAGISVTQYLKKQFHEKSILKLYDGWRSRFVRGIVMCIFDSYWINNLGRQSKE